MNAITLHVIGVDPGRLAGIARLEVGMVGSSFGRPRIASLNTVELGLDAMANAAHLEVVLRGCRMAGPITNGAGPVIGGVEIPFMPKGLHHGQDPILQGRHVGQIEAAAAQLGIRLMAINPSTAKKSLTGHGRAGVKQQLGDTKDSMRARGKAAMVSAARAMDGWEQASLAIPSSLEHLQAAADAVGIALAAFGKFREELLLQRVAGRQLVPSARQLEQLRDPHPADVVLPRDALGLRERRELEP